MNRIRFTQGPETLELGAVSLVRGEWSQPLNGAAVKQVSRPELVAEFGFETEQAGGETSTEESTAAPAKRAGKAATAEGSAA